MKDKSISIPIEYEYLLSFLFGKSNYHAITGTQDIKFLKKTFTNIFKSITRSINLNIYSCDQTQKNELLSICDNALADIKKPANSEILNIRMITNLTKIVFLLIGQVPNNWEKRKTNFNKEWKLDKYRNINYTSNYQQMTFLILDNYKTYSKSINGLSIKKLWDKLNYEFHNDYFKFINWFKNNHFDIYKKII